MYGSDARHSLEPDEMVHLVRGIRAIETMLSVKLDKNDTDSLVDMKHTFEKSLIALVDITPGAVLTKEMIGFKKPGTGISPTRLNEVLGKCVRRAVKANSVLLPSDIEWEERK